MIRRLYYQYRLDRVMTEIVDSIIERESIKGEMSRDSQKSYLEDCIIAINTKIKGYQLRRYHFSKKLERLREKRNSSLTTNKKSSCEARAI